MGSRAVGLGPGSPGFPGRPNDPDVQLQRDDRFGNCKSLAPGGPSWDRVRWEGRTGERKEGREKPEKEGNLGDSEI